MAQDGPVFEFGAFRLDVRERRLTREGHAVPLRAKLFDTLQVLVEHPGRLLTKDELIQRIWPDAVVEENNLNQSISALRRALGEAATGRSYIETIPRIGYRFVAEVKTSGRNASEGTALPVPPATTPRQVVRFCGSADGTRIAYSTVGNGPPLVKSANWLNHLEYEWESPVWKHWISEISERHQLVRYDGRGCGLSDWSVNDLSFDAWVSDLETVVHEMNLDRFALLGISQGGAVAAAYAARHPERVSHLVLYGAYARGWQLRGDERDREAREALVKLTRLGWGRNNPAFRQIFTTRFIPDAGVEQLKWFNDLQRISASPENAARFMEETSRVDVRASLPAITVPTIVFHCQEDNAVPFEEGRLLAAGIPGAKLVPLPSRNHIVLHHEPAWTIFRQELGAFLGWDQRLLP